MVKCGICGRPRPRGQCHIVVLTEAERAQIQNPEDEYVYCRPCWNTLNDPVAGPALMKGVFQLQLRQAGVRNADAAATRYHKQLTKQAQKRS